MNFNRLLKKNGFTLIELLVVIAIIAILAVVAVPALFKNINKSKIAKVESDYNAIKSSILSYYADNNELPKKIDELQIDNLLERKKTPIGGEYKIRCKDNENKIGSLYESEFTPSKAYPVDKEGIIVKNLIELHDKGDAYLTLQGFDNNKLYINNIQFKKIIDDIGFENIFISSRPSGTVYQTGEIYIRLANNILPKPNK